MENAWKLLLTRSYRLNPYYPKSQLTSRIVSVRAHEVAELYGQYGAKIFAPTSAGTSGRLTPRQERQLRHRADR